MSAQLTFDDAFKFVLRWEGGYVNDPRDPGGETNMGISKRSYPNEDIKGMTHERAKEIYYTDYWRKASCHNLPPAVAFVVFDCAINQGVNTANELAQKAIKSGGSIKSQVKTFTIARVVRYGELKLFRTYGTGWVRRAMDACFTALGV